MPENEKPGENTLFIQRMDGELLGWDQPAARLREALDRDHFRLYAQPVVALDKEGEAPDFAEVLVRLREDEAQLLPPGDFLPAFEHYGMMAELDRWVVRHALGRLGRGGRLRKLSVNVSGKTIEDGSFPAFAAEQLRLAALVPAALVIEIDENDAIDRRQAAERFAAAMKEVGCGLTLDGFARRSVSFELLKPLRVDYVKVDGGIVRNVMRSGSAAAKLKAIVHAGQATGVKVIAECVEDDRILASLKLLKVGYAQGFRIRRPEPIDELLET